MVLAIQTPVPQIIPLTTPQTAHHQTTIALITIMHQQIRQPTLSHQQPKAFFKTRTQK